MDGGDWWANPQVRKESDKTEYAKQQKITYFWNVINQGIEINIQEM